MGTENEISGHQKIVGTKDSGAPTLVCRFVGLDVLVSLFGHFVVSGVWAFFPWFVVTPDFFSHEILGWCPDGARENGPLKIKLQKIKIN